MILCAGCKDMRFSLLPERKFDSVTDIEPELLRSMGVELLILDVDNTIAPYKTLTLEKRVTDWAARVRDAGIGLFIVSNNKGERPEVFARLLDIPFLKRAGKPSPRGVRRALELSGIPPERAALAGDQIYTDTIAASLAGVHMLLVEPIRFTNIFLAIRYFFELPFRRERKHN